jgi:hypothetical protein
MAKGITEVLMSKEPLKIDIIDGYPDPSDNVLLWVFQGANRNYYRYALQGVNVVMLNILSNSYSTNLSFIILIPHGSTKDPVFNHFRFP